MHQTSTESGVLELKAEIDPSEQLSAREREGISPNLNPDITPSITIDQVLESARARSIQRERDQLSERRLPNLAPHEHRASKILWVIVALVLVWGHYYLVRSFWAPAHPGVDQNGYQVGGKYFAETFSTGYKPVNPFTYVGWMWVQTPDGWVYPKYPLGIPVLDAICLWIAPNLRTGVEWSYLISPISAVLSSAAMFLMLRMVARGFAAACGMILMATNAVALVLANNSNSHAAAMAFVMWGMLFLMWWMRHGGWWRGLMAGVLLGYAVTIRYTEGLLVLPIAAAVLTGMRYKSARDIRWFAVSLWIALGITGIVLRYATSIPTEGWRTWVPLAVVAVILSLSSLRFSTRAQAWSSIGEIFRALTSAAIVWWIIRYEPSGKPWKDPVGTWIVLSIAKVLAAGLIPLIYSIRWSEPRTYLRPAVVVLGWLIPVVALVAFNKGAMGSITGYDTTNESDGFSWKYFMEKWSFMITQVYNTGLFFVVPLGIAGMFVMYRASARIALIMTLWFVPGLLLYTAYYWGMNTNGVGYLRFFLTLFPPVVFCAVWLMDSAGRRANEGFTVEGIPVERSLRGSVAGPIAMGIVVACTAGMNVYSTRGPMERDFTIQTNLADTADHIFLKMKTAKANPFETDPAKRPILIGEARNFINYMQYAGNFECYTADVFSLRGANRLLRNVDPDGPNPLQHARVEYLKGIYKNKSDNDLLKEGVAIFDKAIADGRRIYVVLPAATMPAFRARLSKSFDLTSLEKWREPVTMSSEGSKALMAMGLAASFVGRATPQYWEMCEMVRKPPAPILPKPAPVKVTTKPATKPAALFEIK